MKEGYWSKKVDVQRAKVQSSELSINLISQDYGMNLNYLNYRSESINYGMSCAVHLSSCETKKKHEAHKSSWLLANKINIESKTIVFH